MTYSCGPSCAISAYVPQSCCTPCSYPVGGLGPLGCCPTSCFGGSTSCGCGPSCTIPTFVAQSYCSPCNYPVGGLGSLSCCPSSCCSSSCCDGSTSASSLGITSGATVSCVNQIPPSEMVVHPPPFAVIIPGPVMAASCEPVRVGGYTACGTSCGPCGYICSSPC